LPLDENFYNLATLNPEVKTKIRYHVTFIKNVGSCFFLAFLTIFTVRYSNL